MSYSDLLLHRLWRTKRQEILHRDNWSCKHCQKEDKKFIKVNENGYEFYRQLPKEEQVNLHVHHLVYRKNRLPWEQPNSDLITLCEDCHTKHHDENELVFANDPNEIDAIEVCSRCGGIGYLEQYRYYHNGICFQCGGARKLPKSWSKSFDDNAFIPPIEAIAKTIRPNELDIEKIANRFSKDFDEIKFFRVIKRLGLLINQLNISTFDERFIIALSGLRPQPSSLRLNVQIGFHTALDYLLNKNSNSLQFQSILIFDETDWLERIEKEMKEAEDILNYKKPYNSNLVNSAQFRKLHNHTLYKAAIDQNFLFDTIFPKIKEQVTKSNAVYNISSETESAPIDLKFLLENKVFFISLFSTHYNFSESNIKFLRDTLEWGGAVYSYYDDQHNYFFHSSSGLSYNDNINWTPDILSVAKFEINHLDATWYDDKLFPLNKMEEVEKSESEFHNILCSQSKDIEELETSLDKYKSKRDYFVKNYFQLTTLELKEIIKDFNESKKYTHGIILNNSFYSEVIRLLNSSICNFNIIDYLYLIKE